MNLSLLILLPLITSLAILFCKGLNQVRWISFAGSSLQLLLSFILLSQFWSERTAGNISLGGIYQTAYRKFYIDELYSFIAKKIIFNLLGKPAAWLDRNIVDGTMNGIAFGTGKISVAIKRMQSGSVQSYAIYFFSGIVLMVLIFVYWRK